MIKVLWAVTFAFAALILACIIRSIIGPRNTDRVLAVNMIGSMGNAVIAILASIYNQNFLADVAILYALLSFTAVLVMSRIMSGVKAEMRAQAAPAEAQAVPAPSETVTEPDTAAEPEAEATQSEEEEAEK